MSNPLLQAFFVGRAAAEILTERLEFAFTDALSELGKFDAEAREQVRSFVEEVVERANRAAEAANVDQTTPGYSQPTSEPLEVQLMVDELRAEIALLRTELQKYRNNSAS